MNEFGSAVANDADIVKHLVTYGVPVEDARAALAADASAVQRVMEIMLANVFRIPSSWLQPFYSYPSDLEAPEAFDESISDWNFYVALKECLSKIGVNNFRWKEGKAEDIDEQFEAVVEQNDELKNSLDQLRREYEVACGDLDDKEAKLLELEQIYADENSKLQSLTLDYQSLANADERADEAAMHAEHQLRAMQAKRESTHKVLEELQSNLCEDQDELLAELAKEKQLTDKYQQEIAAAGTQRSYYAKWTCEVRKHQGDAVKTVRMLEDTLVAQDNEEGLRRQLADAVEAVQAMEATKATAVVQEEQEKTIQELQERTEEFEREQARVHAGETSAAAVIDCGEKQREHAAARVEMLEERIAEAKVKAHEMVRQLEEVACTQKLRQAQCQSHYVGTAAAVRRLAFRMCNLIEGVGKQHAAGVALDKEGKRAAALQSLMSRSAGLRSMAEALGAGRLSGLDDEDSL